MIKKLILLSVTSLISVFAVAQTEDSSWNKLKKDDLIVDAYVGYPNWGAYNLSNYISQLPSSELSSTGGIVPIGIRAEYFLSDEIGFTLNASYSEWGGSWKTNTFYYDSLGQGNTEEYQNSYNASRFVFQIGANYHIPDIEAENFDMYMGLAVGTNNISESLEKDQPDFNAREEMYFLSNGFVFTSSVLAQTPLSIRLRVGGRFFLTENVALNVEAGTGIRTIQFGLTYKL